MRRLFSLLYGGVVYLAFLAVFLYAIAFVGGFAVPKTVDSGASASMGVAVAIDLCLLLLFAVQHSVMARPWFKERWTEVVPKHLERSTYVLAATAVLALMMWAWRPIPEIVWSVEGTGATVLWGIFAAGWAVVLISTFLIDHFDLFGLKQVWARFRERDYRYPEFQTPAFYQYVRHPLYLGFLMAFWAIPEMTAGHLLFAAATTGYILVAVRFEERDLIRYHGQAYARYRERVPMILPWRGEAAGGPQAEEVPEAAG